MFRKSLAILFLIVAQIVILGHGLVSHHHHTDTVQILFKREVFFVQNKIKRVSADYNTKQRWV